MTTHHDTLEADVLTRREFGALPEYSHSMPSGTTIGKKWRRREPYRDDDGPPFCWYTGEYVPDPQPGTVGIKWRRVVIVNCKSGEGSK